MHDHAHLQGDGVEVEVPGIPEGVVQSVLYLPELIRILGYELLVVYQLLLASKF